MRLTLPATLAMLLLAACSAGQPVALEPSEQALPPTPTPAISVTPEPAPVLEVVAAWAVAVPHARGVLDLTLEQVRAVVAGAVRDWAQIGGEPGPLMLVVPEQDREAIEQAAGVRLSEAARAVPLAEIGQILDAFLITPVDALHPAVQAVVVEGHDPYRDPAMMSPLRLERPAGEERTAAQRSLAPLAAVDPVGLLVTGELIPARCTYAVLAALDDFGAMFDGTRSLLAAADLAVVPLEVPLSDRGEPTPCVETFVLQGGAGAIPAIAEAGVDVVLMVGNHILDCWAPGCSPSAVLLDTLEGLRQVGVATVGAGATLEEARRPLVLEAGGVRVAFLAYDDVGFHNAAGPGVAGSASLDFETLALDVAAAGRLADHVFVGFNWGVEYTVDPTERQRRAARIAIEAGATIVAGNHPHVVQAIEAAGGTLIAYSLGNFVFDQDWSEETQQSIILEVGLTRDRLLGYRLRPVVIRDRHRPELVSPTGEGRAPLARIREATDRLTR